jgi:tRNA-2-methylthio-N6-dimethylallyladenosine synthase
MKYHLITYGCQMNVADSEEMAQPLKERGFLATDKLHEADIVLMNTCTVREQAEHRADSNIGRLRVWKEKDPNRILIVAGCAASRWGDSIQKKYPFIDLVSPATNIEQFPEAVAQVLKERWDWADEIGATFGANGVLPNDVRPNDVSPNVVLPNDVTNLFGDDRTAYITIMRGCNYSCSYCIVPQVRGREIYRPMPEILSEVRTKVSAGYNEIMLLGQTVNSYHWREMRDVGADRCPPANGNSIQSNSIDNSLNISGAQRCAPTVPMDFADLLRSINSIEGVEIIRFMSPHPRHMKDRMIQAMTACSKVARHMHLPVQSGSDRLLGAMKRLYTRGEYLAIVEKLRAAMPGILITTDIIVGYPGETTAEFEETLSLLRRVRFDGLFAFKYSPRPATASAEAPDNVPDSIKEDRLQHVLALNTEIKKDLAEVSA